jgi:hypothetical protein
MHQERRWILVLGVPDDGLQKRHFERRIHEINAERIRRLPRIGESTRGGSIAQRIRVPAKKKVVPDSAERRFVTRRADESE